MKIKVYKTKYLFKKLMRFFYLPKKIQLYFSKNIDSPSKSSFTIFIFYYFVYVKLLNDVIV